jgi:hypothetical protein
LNFKIKIADSGFYAIADWTLSVAEKSASRLKYVPSVRQFWSTSGQRAVDSGQKIAAPLLFFDTPTSGHLSYCIIRRIFWDVWLRPCGGVGRTVWTGALEQNGHSLPTFTNCHNILFRFSNEDRLQNRQIYK